MPLQGGKWYSDEKLAKMSDKKRDKVMKKKAEADNKLLMAHQLDWQTLQNTQIPWRGVVKLRGAKTYYGVVSLNYLVFYKNGGKEPAGVKGKGYYAFEKIIAMQKLSSPKDITLGKDGKTVIIVKPANADKKSKNAEWQITCEDKLAADKLNTELTRIAMDAIPAWSHLLELSVDGDSYHLFDTMRQLFPRKINIDNTGKAEKVPQTVKQMVEYMMNARQYAPIAQKMKYFHEFYNERSKEYVNWVAGNGEMKSADGGLLKMLEKEESKLLKHWKMWIDRALLDLPEFRHERFFADDLKEVVEKGQNAVIIYDGMYDYRKRVWKDADEFCAEHKPKIEEIKKWIKLYSLIPASDKLSLETLGFIPGMPPNGPPLSAGEGKLEQYLGSWERWKWYEDKTFADKGIRQWVMLCESHTQEKPYWFMRDGFCIKSVFHGTIMWNRSSWVWFHPKIRFIIRYVWDARNRTYRFSEGKGGRAAWILGQVALPDWHWNDEKAGLEPVQADDRKMESMHLYKVSEGYVPIPIIMTVCMTQHLHDTIIFMMNQVQDVSAADGEEIEVVEV